MRIDSYGWKYKGEKDLCFKNNTFINNKANFGGAAIRINGFNNSNTANGLYEGGCYQM